MAYTDVREWVRTNCDENYTREAQYFNYTHTLLQKLLKTIIKGRVDTRSATKSVYIQLI